MGSVTALLRHLLLTLAIAGLYVGAAKLGLTMALLQQTVSPVWPPSGLALALTLLLGHRSLPGVALGAFLVPLSTGVPPVACGGIAIGNTIEPLTAAYLIRRFAGGSQAFVRARDVFKFCGFTAVATGLSASVGVFCLLVSGLIETGTIAELGRTWWTGNLVGALLFAPLIITWTSPFYRRDGAALVEGAVFTLGVVVATGLVFGLSWGSATLLYPFMLWTAFRFGVRGTAATLLLMAGLMVIGTIFGEGPFIKATPHDSILRLQTFLGIGTMGSLALAAMVSELQRARDEIERRNDELQRANAHLQELDRLKGQFLNMVSHELRTPLVSIMGYAEFLEDGIGGPLSEDQQVYVTRIQQGTRRLRHLVDDLLDYTRLKAGTFRLTFQDTDLGIALQNAVQSLQPMALASRLNLRCILPDEPTPLSIDPDRIEQAVINLLANAIKFSPEGADIDIELSVSETEARIEVRDSGKGIALEHQKRLFEQFYQVDPSLTRSHGGLGLGLAIAKVIIEAHGGRIGVVSEPGRGATFWFSLPVLTPADRSTDPLRLIES